MSLSVGRLVSRNRPSVYIIFHIQTTDVNRIFIERAVISSISRSLGLKRCQQCTKLEWWSIKSNSDAKEELNPKPNHVHLTMWSSFLHSSSQFFRSPIVIHTMLTLLPHGHPVKATRSEKPKFWYNTGEFLSSHGSPRHSLAMCWWGHESRHPNTSPYPSKAMPRTGRQISRLKT